VKSALGIMGTGAKKAGGFIKDKVTNPFHIKDAIKGVKDYKKTTAENQEKLTAKKDEVIQQSRVTDVINEAGEGQSLSEAFAGS
jgi:hypothetical protein